jgi:hypothetical protein
MSGTGDFHKEEFTAEELAVLGEAEGSGADKTDEGAGKSPDELKAEEDKAKAEADAAAEGKSKTEEKKPEEISEDDKAVIAAEGVQTVTDEKTGKTYVIDEDGEKIPFTRWRKLYAESKGAKSKELELTNKLNLFKQLGAEEYYKQFPNERPANYTPPKPAQAQDLPTGTDEWVITGGKYDGMTLGEVAQENLDDALTIYNNSIQEQKKPTNAVLNEETQKQMDEQFQNEQKQFFVNRAKEIFKKESGLSQAELNAITNKYLELTHWMNTNDKVMYSLEDAYRLMTYEKSVQSARIEGSKAALEKLTKEKPISIGGGDGGAKPSGFDGLLAMTEGQLEKHIDAMSDKESREFFKNAPMELRKKYPFLPWENAAT